MPLILKGVMQSPVTPLKADFSPDLETFERLLDFHVRTGATAISWPHHKGESLNLTIAERKRFAEVAVKTVAGRVPVSIHVSALAVEDSIDLARHAQAVGADAIIAITPYFWNPSPAAIHDWFMRLGREVDLPIIAYNSPSYLDGVEFTGELITSLLEKLPNLVAMKEASFDSEKFLEISRAALAVRPDFSLVAGVEFLLPSIPLGGKGSYSSAGAICPNLCTRLYASCVEGRWDEARDCQYKLSQLWQLFRDQYPSSLKGGMVIMGRPVGPTRPPLPTASEKRIAFIAEQLGELGILDTEPHGW
ncbi:MAG: dihydrodipicolinate synthase family protein [Rhodocyclaceae bacterium]|nr:dihydrodipicolinate synthase family protein [Rhodocyclaceae bacterium]MCA3076508.1 dihydrodipicolinate synthase family protein [Rhodocyclaceae bacterium]MCA3090143.1 dihydrodipicolinate synthase family protein [Rhodocyclaceae bacterium]MCA3093853.1 dihydrodipicolinate synthase family protein [Rhodocyclaceae bacterium]MCA3098782.1 dihydrodipicolinate synthase family protein [Rhodocyclaceae bacterium]